jgi:phenylpropionate dioxygenase-like ring-hydroxylating dioxygenase large terminal subunit
VGFSFIIILGKDRQLRAFHNVCRHRAYAVTKKESGSSIILGCRYHGWSYDTRGKLIKAPEFENVEGFDKEVNGLWELKLEVQESFVFVNFNTGPVVTKPHLDNSSSLVRWNIEKMECVAEWKMDGKFNWKLAEGSCQTSLD